MRRSESREGARRLTSHPALRAFGVVFLVRDLVVAVLAIGGLIAGGVAHQDMLWIGAAAVGVLALAALVASSLAGQRGATAAEGPPAPADAPARRNPLLDVLRQQPSPELDVRRAVAGQVSSGAKLRAEMSDAQEQGGWDDEGWAYRRRVEAWTERTVRVLEGCGRDDLARALTEVEAPPAPPFQTLLQGHSPSYARLAGVLDGRIALLERSQG
jgi:hypothetical protein